MPRLVTHERSNRRCSRGSESDFPSHVGGNLNTERAKSWKTALSFGTILPEMIFPRGENDNDFDQITSNRCWDPSEIGYDDVIGNKFYVNLYHINYG